MPGFVDHFPDYKKGYTPERWFFWYVLTSLNPSLVDRLLNHLQAKEQQQMNKFKEDIKFCRIYCLEGLIDSFKHIGKILIHIIIIITSTSYRCS